MSTRSRAAATCTALLAAALVLSGCGARAGDTSTPAPPPCVDTSGASIRVGALNSLSGSTALAEVPIRDAIVMALEEINRSGGVLGKQVQLFPEDGASDPTTFAEKAQKLVRADCVAAVFGGYTSASRKAMLPVFEENDALLYYPQQYEGLEASRNVFYSGATTNQQIIPSLDHLRRNGVRSLYLVGSDYVFPRTSNAIVRAYAQAHGMEIRGEDYAPLGSTDFSTIMNKVRASEADAVFNVVVGDSLTAFFQEYRNVNLTPQQMPVMSMCVGEEEVASIGAQNLVGQLSAWDYYQSLGTPENQAFVAAVKERYGAQRVTSDPMASAYAAVQLWKAMVERARAFDVPALQRVADGTTVEAPEGRVTLDGVSHHITKTARIGVVQPDGQFRITDQSGGPIPPDPFLETYDWARSVSGA